MNPWYLHRTSLVLAVSAAVAGSAGIAVWWARTHRKSAEEKERLRRQYLLQHGRMIDATVLDWSEQPNLQTLHLLHYRYTIAGVVYECAQDVSQLQNQIQIDSSWLGMPATARYDPHNPANSILVAERWSGLHPAAQSNGKLAPA